MRQARVLPPESSREDISPIPGIAVASAIGLPCGRTALPRESDAGALPLPVEHRMLVQTDRADSILNEIVSAAQLNDTGRGIAFVIPVEKVVGPTS